MEKTPKLTDNESKEAQRRQPVAKNEVGVVSFNCCLSVCPPLRFNGAPQRAERLPDAIYTSIPPALIDVLCFQELLVSDEAILKDLIHHSHHTSPITTSLFGNNIRILPSGLTIASKWPIVEEDAHVFFGATYNLEAFMAKAVQYAKIVMNGGRDILHVFNTHLQAWTAPRACSIRKSQSRQTALFIKRKLIDWRKGEHVIIAGDWNIDDMEHQDIVEDIMKILEASMLRPKTVQFSFDPCTNPLVGTDDAAEYATRSKQNGCYPEFLRTGICACCPRQLVDGVAIHDHSRSDLLSYDVNVVPIKSRSPFEVHVNMSTQRTIETVSDHYAIFARMAFPVSCSALRYDDSIHRNSFKSSPHLGWVTFQLVLFAVLLLLFWLLLNWIGSYVHASIVPLSPGIFSTIAIQTA